MFYLILMFIIGILMLVIFFRKYAIGLVQENSMYPTFEHNEIVLIKKDFDLFSDEVYLFKLDDGDRYFIKRLDHFEVRDNEILGLYFLGDNQEQSYDSRNFGYVCPSSVAGEVIKIFGGKLKWLKK